MELRGSEIGREGFEPSTLGLREPLRDLGLPQPVWVLWANRALNAPRVSARLAATLLSPEAIYECQGRALQRPDGLAHPTPSGRHAATLVARAGSDARGRTCESPRSAGAPRFVLSRIPPCRLLRAGSRVIGVGERELLGPHALVRTTDGGEAHGFRALAFTSGSSLRCCCCG